MPKKTPLVLMILDGWGYSEEIAHNAIAAAHTPQWDTWWKTCPRILLDASGLPVGLPDAQMGNSEVGHMHIGAGRIIQQDYTQINAACENGEFAKNPVFLDAINDLKQRNHALHILGLLSSGGVHSHEEHLFAFLKLCAEQQFSNVYLHLFLDGRDTSPQSAGASLEKLQATLMTYPVATISSITGRYYAMDRDQRWQRVEPVYCMLTEPPSTIKYASAQEAVTDFYQQHIFDEFIPPTQIGVGREIRDGDSVFFFNFRADRARELTQALIADEFTGFSRAKKPTIAQFISMTSYSKTLATRSAFPGGVLHNTLGEVLAKNGLQQLRAAETEKYAHVTFFLNGGSEQPFAHEERILVNSPKVATYDLQPEMSAPELTCAIIAAIQQNKYDVIICNYANADMVGHTGDFDATVKAIECLDQAMSTIWQALSRVNGQLVITADHGNAESMFDDTTHQAHTAHTSQPVPLLYVGKKEWRAATLTGSLIDVAPTLLALLGITPPPEMTGHVLLVNK